MDNASQGGCVVAAVEQIVAYARSLIDDNFSSQLVDNVALGVAVIAGAVVLGEVTTRIQAGYDWWSQSHSNRKNAATMKADNVTAMQSGDGRQLRFDGVNLVEDRINRKLRRALQSRLIGVARYRSRCRRDLENETEDTSKLPSVNDREKRLESIEKKMDQMTFELGELQKRIDKLTGRFTCGECSAKAVEH